MPPRSVLKDHCVQHLPDGSVTVESILIQAAAHSEDPGTKVLLVSWTYQVCGRTQEGLRLAVRQDRWGHPITLGHLGGVGRIGRQPPDSHCRTKSWGATSPPCSRRVCPRHPAEAADRPALCPSGGTWASTLGPCLCPGFPLWMWSPQLATAFIHGDRTIVAHVSLSGRF